ncbi:uncharacterized protein METZ01_LOCUS140972, partial [marine metagenome]
DGSRRGVGRQGGESGTGPLIPFLAKDRGAARRLRRGSGRPAGRPV